MSIGSTGKLFFYNYQLLLYTKRFWFSLDLKLFPLILNLKMLLQVTISSLIQGKVASTWSYRKHHSWLPCYCKMYCESIENMSSFSMLKENHATIMAKLLLDCRANIRDKTTIFLLPKKHKFRIEMIPNLHSAKELIFF